MGIQASNNNFAQLNWDIHSHIALFLHEHTLYKKVALVNKQAYNKFRTSSQTYSVIHKLRAESYRRYSHVPYLHYTWNQYLDNGNKPLLQCSRDMLVIDLSNILFLDGRQFLDRKYTTFTTDTRGEKPSPVPNGLSLSLRKYEFTNYMGASAFIPLFDEFPVLPSTMLILRVPDSDDKCIVVFMGIFLDYHTMIDISTIMDESFYPLELTFSQLKASLDSGGTFADYFYRSTKDKMVGILNDSHGTQLGVKRNSSSSRVLEAVASTLGIEDQGDLAAFLYYQCFLVQLQWDKNSSVPAFKPDPFHDLSLDLPYAALDAHLYSSFSSNKRLEEQIKMLVITQDNKELLSLILNDCLFDRKVSAALLPWVYNTLVEQHNWSNEDFIRALTSSRFATTALIRALQQHDCNALEFLLSKTHPSIAKAMAAQFLEKHSDQFTACHYYEPFTNEVRKSNFATLVQLTAELNKDYWIPMVFDCLPDLSRMIQDEDPQSEACTRIMVYVMLEVAKSNDINRKRKLMELLIAREDWIFHYTERNFARPLTVLKLLEIIRILQLRQLLTYEQYEEYFSLLDHLNSLCIDNNKWSDVKDYLADEMDVPFVFSDIALECDREKLEKFRLADPNTCYNLKIASFSRNAKKASTNSVVFNVHLNEDKKDAPLKIHVQMLALEHVGIHIFPETVDKFQQRIHLNEEDYLKEVDIVLLGDVDLGCEHLLEEIIEMTPKAKLRILFGSCCGCSVFARYVASLNEFLYIPKFPQATETTSGIPCVLFADVFKHYLSIIDTPPLILGTYLTIITDEDEYMDLATQVLDEGKCLEQPVWAEVRNWKNLLVDVITKLPERDVRTKVRFATINNLEETIIDICNYADTLIESLFHLHRYGILPCCLYRQDMVSLTRLSHLRPLFEKIREALANQHFSDQLVIQKELRVRVLEYYILLNI
jgi:hypothetical protein